MSQGSSDRWSNVWWFPSDFPARLRSAITWSRSAQRSIRPLLVIFFLIFILVFQSFMRRVTKRVSEYIPGMTWMNTLISDAQTDDDRTSMTENDDQPPVKKLCTSNNSFTNTKYPPTNSTDNHRGSSELLSINLV